MSTQDTSSTVRGKNPCEEAKEIWKSCDAVCFDVDSTVTKDEGLDKLASYCGKGEEVKKITIEAMQGEIDYRESLRRRLDILQPSLELIRNFTQANPPNLSKDVDKLVDLLQSRGVDVYLVSGGFRSIIAPIAKQLHIPLENIFANRIKFYYDGVYGGFDETQLTSRTGGKAEVVFHLRKREGYTRMVMIGDGITDMEAYPAADTFIGFGGNVVREVVERKAPWYVYDFKTLIDELLKED